MRLRAACALLALVSCLPNAAPLRADDKPADEAYFMTIFSSQRDPNNDPRFAHTFAAFVKTTGRGDSPETKVETHTISWMPATLDVVLLADAPETGVNLDLPGSLKLAEKVGARVSMWGPYEVKKELYDRAVRQEALLKKGMIQYKAMDGSFRPNYASNCMHVVSDLDVGSGMLETGRSYGEGGSQLVADHLKRWIVDPGKTHPWVSDRLGLRNYPATARGLN